MSFILAAFVLGGVTGALVGFWLGSFGHSLSGFFGFWGPEPTFSECCLVGIRWACWGCVIGADACAFLAALSALITAGVVFVVLRNHSGFNARCAAKGKPV